MHKKNIVVYSLVLTCLFILAWKHLTRGLTTLRNKENPHFNNKRMLLDDQLKEFTAQLTPKEKTISKGKEIIQRVVESMNEHSPGEITRVFLGGAIGKETAIKTHLRFELFIFLKQKLPDFEEVTRSVRSKLMTEIENKEMKTSSSSLSFKIESLSFVLRFASNLSPDQLEGTIEAINCENDPIEASEKYFDFIAEYEAIFIRNQPNFVKSAIKLVMFWAYKNSLVPSNDHESEKMNLIFELMTIESCKRALRKKRFESLSAIFIEFLHLATRMKKLRILNENFYSKFDVAKDIFNQVPLILHPLNPWYNLASKLQENKLNNVKKCAKKTIEQFTNFTSVYSNYIPYEILQEFLYTL